MFHKDHVLCYKDRFRLSCFQDTLPAEHTDRTVFIFVAINLGKQYLKEEVPMEFSRSGVGLSDAAQCSGRLSSREDVWL